MPLVLPFHALRPAADLPVPWEMLLVGGLPFAIALGLILLCRDVKPD